jgi:hypothetical protein
MDLTMTTATVYRTTCRLCEVIGEKISAVFARLIEMGEQAGRSKAASELARQGYYAEAKALMLELAEVRKEIEARKAK